MNPNSNTTIVPCGIYHSEAHIFRSRVLVEFGPPINVSKMLAERYRAGHREDAIRQLLNGINESLRDIITAAAADEETLSVSRCFKRTQ
jgi:glycerol-3-phosphate O-acyltransferase/dihydroxyacetone phosphate acyltransferase